MDFKVLKSELDHSVNFITNKENGLFEARYVYRPNNDYCIGYLSSHNGCNRSCRMCHLTQTSQTMEIPATMNEYMEQADKIINYIKSEDFINKNNLNFIHWNLMAKGEPLFNPVIQDNFDEFKQKLDDKAFSIGFKDLRVLVSTIMPIGMKSILETFPSFNADIYYSLYSLNQSFRKRFLPKSISPNEALLQLSEYYKNGGVVKIHHALIPTENDSEHDANEIVNFMKKHHLTDLNFNLVSYNPFDGRKDTHEDLMNKEKYLNIISEVFKIREIPKVGFDVSASCGMFQTGDNK